MLLDAVTLDAAGTLLEPVEAVGVTYARVAARHGISVAAAAAEDGFRAALASAPPLAFGDVDPRRVADHERRWWLAIVRRALGTAADSRVLEACAHELFALYGRASAWRVYPEVRATLTRLRGRGLRLGVVSNFDGRLAPLLAHLDLASLLDTIVHSSGVGTAKPDPGIFHDALARLGTVPARALHVGDGLVADVAGARAAGLAAVLLDREGHRPPLPPGVGSITTLAELLALTE